MGPALSDSFSGMGTLLAHAYYVQERREFALCCEGGEMVRHYSTRDFFRQMPNRLLARYFQERGLFGDLDFAALKEAQPEVFTAWLELPDDQRKPMDAEFRDIFELSCEKGFCAIRDEAAWHLEAEPQIYAELVEKLAALANHYERAMITFLDHAGFWKGATLFYLQTPCPTGASGRTCRASPLRCTRKVGRSWPARFACTFTRPRDGATIAWWRRSAGANWTTSLLIPRTTPKRER